MVPSESGFVTIAGMAGSEEDLCELPESDRGRIAILKMSSRPDGTFRMRLRSRISTAANVSSRTDRDIPIEPRRNGKPGIGQCRFRSDGRIFAVGGWDKRVRIYDRRTSEPLALLRGHLDSVNAIDWSFDAVHSGLLATGSTDGRVHVWQCFPSMD
jgi:WD40 repeat protein